MKTKVTILSSIFILFIFLPTVVMAEENEYTQRMELYQKVEMKSSVPWYYIAAVDQFERSIRFVRNDLPKPEGIDGFYLPPEKWSGPLNPKNDDENLHALFFGLGVDGNEDNHANHTDHEDLLFTLAKYLQTYGINDEQFRQAIWNYYKRDATVKAIMVNTQLFRTFNRIDLNDKVFPLTLGTNYSYKNTWGNARGWGGRRIHEGTDLFANYGAEIRSVGYGVIELKGWNKFGGWRIGIRDVNNTYHYYAHLNSFNNDLAVGSIVEPGTVIGTVGSSGYGPPGTSGKFPPHLHYGMYKDDGKNEWAFNPYPHLINWERNQK